MESESEEFDMGGNYDGNGIGELAMMKRRQRVYGMKDANSAFGGHGNNYHKMNINHDNDNDDNDNDYGDDDSKESKSHSGKSDKNDDDDDDDDDDKDKRRIRRYPLPRRHGKTFETLFFHHKDKVMELLDSFAHRQDKFAIRGSAHKMTWLLYGPPGTGKTSLVKAMAQYLERHVVIINLAAIRNFHELQDWMHNPYVTAENKAIHSEDSESDSSDLDSYDACCFDADRAMYKQWRREERQRRPRRWRNREKRDRFTLAAKSVIYLLEDVDAVSMEDITINNSTTTNINNNTNNANNAMTVEKMNLADNDNTQENISPSDQVPVETVKIKSKYELGNCGKLAGGRKTHNGLSITDLVRVLTNPVAPEGRFVILTTNHIENVHPLLLQLNVVDNRIMMGYVDINDAQRIIEHYYQCVLTLQQRHELEVIAEHIEKRVQDEFCSVKQHHMGVRDSAQRDNALSLLHTSSLSAQYNGFSPASLEQMCAEEETVEDLLRTMRCKYFESDKRDDLEVF